MYDVGFVHKIFIILIYFLTLTLFLALFDSTLTLWWARFDFLVSFRLVYHRKCKKPKRRFKRLIFFNTRFVKYAFYYYLKIFKKDVLATNFPIQTETTSLNLVVSFSVLKTKTKRQKFFLSFSKTVPTTTATWTYLTTKVNLSTALLVKLFESV